MSNGKAITLGIQHLLAMYAGAILVPLIIGQSLGFTDEQKTYLVAIDILMCGIATLIQVMRGKYFGIGLPVVLGCTFTAVSPIITIGLGKGIGAIYGAIIVSGIIIILISGIFGKLVKFFPPVVTGSVVTIIAVSLVPVAMNNMAGGDSSAADYASFSNIALAFTTLIIILLIYRFTTGFIRSISILLGLIFGTIIGAFIGKVDFKPVIDAGWFHMVQPFYFGTPTFDLASIITMTLVAMVSLVESSGVYFALADIEKKQLKSSDLSRGYRSEGLASIIGGIFNAFPYTTFSQNVGLIKMTGVKERKVIFITGAMLVVLGFLPKIAALTTIIPTSVLGGAMLAMFGMVLTQGITMLAPEILKSPENTMIAAISVALGVGVAFMPDIFKSLPESISIFSSNGIVCGSITAIVLNILFNMIGPKKEKSKIEQ